MALFENSHTKMFLQYKTIANFMDMVRNSSCFCNIPANCISIIKTMLSPNILLMLLEKTSWILKTWTVFSTLTLPLELLLTIINQINQMNFDHSDFTTPYDKFFQCIVNRSDDLQYFMFSPRSLEHISCNKFGNIEKFVYN